MIITNGNLLNTNINIIAHQVNCQGVMGAGVAKQIKEKYPAVYKDYRRLCEDTSNKMDLLGTCLISIEKENKMICNLFGQYNYGRNGTYTNTSYLSSAILLMINMLEQIYNIKDKTHPQLVIAIPYKIGCGLGGGNWEEVKTIFENIERSYNVLFVAYDIRRDIINDE